MTDGDLLPIPEAVLPKTPNLVGLCAELIGDIFMILETSVADAPSA